MANFKHKLSKTTEYKTWLNMIHRCYNPDHSAYEDYGARGITVCDEWRDAKTGLETFMSDMGPRPNSSFSIERKDNNKGYSPSNCVWADVSTQLANRRPYRSRDCGFGRAVSSSGRISILVPYKGELKTAADLTKATGIRGRTITGRYLQGYRDDDLFKPGRITQQKRHGIKDFLINKDNDND